MKEKNKTKILAGALLLFCFLVISGCGAAKDKTVHDRTPADNPEAPEETEELEELVIDEDDPGIPGNDLQANEYNGDHYQREDEEAAPEAPGVTKLVFTGDVEISTSVQAKYDADGVNGVVSERLFQILYDADSTMINHEFCFSLRGEKNPEKQFTFRVDPSYVTLLTDMGVDIVGLANNHVLDYGKTALLDTFTTLDDAGIEYTGAGNSLEEASKLIVKSCPDGRTVGFLAASHVIPSVDWNVTNSQPGEFCFYDETDLLQSIEKAKQEVDLLFVMVHWGVERTTQLTDYQVNDAHRFIDAGADAVIGMHSHCLQPIEIYQGKPVFYSLGNFIFNKNIGSGGGGCVEVTIQDNMAPRYRVIPTSASNALTDIDEAGFRYLEQISDGILVDPDGFIEEKP